MKKSILKNVITNKESNTYTVQLSTGKTREYKTLIGAEKAAIKTRIGIQAPSIVTANCYMWSPNTKASERRRVEYQRQFEIDAFAQRISIGDLVVSGEYRETCGNVYKSMSYTIADRKTNITGAIGYLKKWGINVIK